MQRGPHTSLYLLVPRVMYDIVHAADHVYLHHTVWRIPRNHTSFVPIHTLMFLTRLIFMHFYICAALYSLEAVLKPVTSVPVM